MRRTDESRAFVSVFIYAIIIIITRCVLCHLDRTNNEGRVDSAVETYRIFFFVRPVSVQTLGVCVCVVEKYDGARRSSGRGSPDHVTKKSPHNVRQSLITRCLRFANSGGAKTKRSRVRVSFRATKKEKTNKNSVQTKPQTGRHDVVASIEIVRYCRRCTHVQ